MKNEMGEVVSSIKVQETEFFLFPVVVLARLGAESVRGLFPISSESISFEN